MGVALLTRLSLVLPKYTTCGEDKGCRVEVLTVLWASPLIFKQSVSSNLFSNDTLHYK